MKKLEAAWLAGIIEGEGSFVVGPHRPKHGTHTAVSVNMTDEDVVRRLETVSGVGAVYGPRSRGPHKPQWMWVVTKVSDVVTLVEALLPWMGKRRTVAAKKLLQACQEKLDRMSHCLQGHAYEPDNYYTVVTKGKKPYRRCKICHRASASKYRAKVKR